MTEKMKIYLNQNQLNILNLILRVSQVYMIDYIFLTNFGFIKKPFFQEIDINLGNITLNDMDNDYSNLYESNKSKSLFSIFPNQVNYEDNVNPNLTQNLVTFLKNFAWFLTAITSFFFPIRALIKLCQWAIIICLLFASYFFNQYYLHQLTSIPTELFSSEFFNLNSNVLMVTASNFLFQIITTIILSKLIPNKNNKIFLFKTSILLMMLLFTPYTYKYGIPINVILTIVRSLSLFFKLINDYYVFSEIFIYDLYWSLNVIEYQGIYYLFNHQFEQLKVLLVFNIFLILKMTQHIGFIVFTLIFDSEISDKILKTKDSFIILKYLMSISCETFISVLAVASVLTSISNYLRKKLQQFLKFDENISDEIKSIGSVSGVLFSILALQTGLTNITFNRRFIRLYRNLCLLLTANLHIIHNFVNLLLFTLSASGSLNRSKHLRALLVSLFLIVFPTWFLFYLWENNSLSTWLFAVTVFCTELILKVALTLVIYFLFMLNAFYFPSWEKVDDYVYWIKAFGNTIEFIFAHFIFLNGTYILVFESGGLIRALMMIIHVHFNIWMQAQAGWQAFIKRRRAMQKLDVLSNATPEQIRNLNDVCAICYQELKTSKITKCSHYFHEECLRKWLYIQDECPLCHEILFISKKEINKVN